MSFHTDHSAAFILIIDCLIFRVDKDTRPGCGVEDYVNTWNDFYDAANLKETYNFLSPQSASASYGQASFAGRQGLREISPANLTDRAAWSPLADDYDFHIDSSQGRSDRDPTSSVVRCKVEHSSTVQGSQIMMFKPPLCISQCLCGIRAPIIDSFYAWKPLLSPHNNTLKGTKFML